MYLRTVYRLLMSMCLACMLSSSCPDIRPSPTISVATISRAEFTVQYGDLVFRRATGAGSQFIDTLDQQSSFSHVGMVYIASLDEIFVIHVLPQEPDVVRLEPLSAFLQNAAEFAIYRPKEIISHEAVGAVQQALEWVGEKEFDRDFDLQTDETVYCTELVYKAYRTVGIDLVQGHFNLIDFPFLDVKEVIYPSLLIESNLFDLIYPNDRKGDMK